MPTSIQPLDAHPLNELGKGLLDPDVEAKLLAEGVVFAAIVRPSNPKVPPYLTTSRRPIADVATEALSDAYRRGLLGGASQPAAESEPVLA